MPEVYEFDNYREFLRSYYSSRKEAGGRFSYRNFSKQLGFSSPNFVKLVIEGDRNLSDKGLTKVISGLKFDKNESVYFESLVKLEGEANESERKKLKQKILFCKAVAEVQRIKSGQKTYLTNWKYPVIREMTLLKHFREDPNWIANHLDLKVTPAEAKEAFELLISLGLLEKNTKNRWVPKDRQLRTDLEIEDEDIYRIHEEFIQAGKNSIRKTDEDLRDVSSLTVAVNEKSFRAAKKMIQKFRKDLNVLLSQQKDVDAVYQLNIQFFNMTKVNWAAGEDEE